MVVIVTENVKSFWIYIFETIYSFILNVSTLNNCSYWKDSNNFKKTPKMLKYLKYLCELIIQIYYIETIKRKLLKIPSCNLFFYFTIKIFWNVKILNLKMCLKVF